MLPVACSWPLHHEHHLHCHTQSANHVILKSHWRTALAEHSTPDAWASGSVAMSHKLSFKVSAVVASTQNICQNLNHLIRACSNIHRKVYIYSSELSSANFN